MMSDVNLDRSLLVKGQRSDGRLQYISYRSFTNEHYQAMGQGSCQALEIFRVSRVGGERF